MVADRAYHRVLKLARTIAGLAGSEAIQAAHIAEAIELWTESADIGDREEATGAIMGPALTCDLSAVGRI